MSRRKTKALLKTLYTGLLIPAVQQLAAGITVAPAATYYVTVSNPSSVINGVLLGATALAAALVHEHYHELDLTEEEAALVRRASRRVSKLLAARFADLEVQSNDTEDSESQNASQ